MKAAKKAAANKRRRIARLMQSSVRPIDGYENRPQQITKYEPALDYKHCREEMLINMRRLALRAKDERVKLAATKMLHDIILDYEDRQAEQKRHMLASVKSGEIESIVTELLTIVKPEEKPPIEMEVVASEEVVSASPALGEIEEPAG